MKRLVPVIAFIAGLIAGGFLLLRNPLEAVGALDPLLLRATATEHVGTEARGFDIGPGLFFGTGRGNTLPDAANRHARVSVHTLAGTDSFPAALAVKTSILSPQNSLWRARLGTLDYWTIAVPGQGIIFAAGYSNYWNVLRDLLAASWGSGRSKLPQDTYPLSALPPVGHATGVIGATGRFAGQGGEIREYLLPRTGDQPAWRLELRLDRPTVAGTGKEARRDP